MNKEILKAKIAEAISSTNKSGNEKLETILAAVDAYSSASNSGKPLVSGSLPLDEFIGDVEHMMKLYGNSRYTQAEEWRDKLAERLDDIMRLGGNDR